MFDHYFKVDLRSNLWYTFDGGRKAVWDIRGPIKSTAALCKAFVDYVEGSPLIKWKVTLVR